MINRSSRHNKGKFVTNSELCNTLPYDIKEVDVCYDWSYKLQCCIHSPYQPITETTNVLIGSLHEAKNQLLIEAHWTIKNM